MPWSARILRRSAASDVRGQDHAAFARRDVLRRVEAETPELAERPAWLTAPFGLDGVRTVLDDR